MRHSGTNIRRLLIKAGAATIAASLTAPLSTFAAAPGKMKIGIVGSGRVGTAIGTAWIKTGHEVMFSSTSLEKNKQLAATLGPNAKAGTPREAAAFGDVLVVSVPYTALPLVGKELADLIKGKIIIDTSNPIVPRDGEMGIAAREKGAGLASAEFLPGARIVRAFNAVGSARMAAAAQNAGTFGMPIAGEDPKAIETASALIRDVGYEPVLIGGYAMGRLSFRVRPWLANVRRKKSGKSPQHLNSLVIGPGSANPAQQTQIRSGPQGGCRIHLHDEERAQRTNLRLHETNKNQHIRG